MLRTSLLAAALLLATVSAAVPVVAGEPQASSWSSDKMRLKARPGPTLPFDELAGNCPGLTVTIKTRIERLKALQDKATAEQWPPPRFQMQWAKRPLDGDIARQRELIARLNAALGAKGCQTVDVDAELRQLPATSAATTKAK
jgi:hypothetical protein